MATMIYAHELAFQAMTVLLMLIIFVFLVAAAEDHSFFGRRNLEVKRRIDHLRKHARKSIQSEDGDVIDCIDIDKQPAFDHPALKNHTLQLTPSFDPIMEDSRETSTTRSQDVSQLWKKSGSCPKGTIPVRRIHEKELLKANSTGGYGRKKASAYPSVAQLNDSNSNSMEPNRSMVILFTEGLSYAGVKGDLTVWNPYVESDDEYSLALMNLKSGPWYDFESVEAGWAVNPGVYGDRETRLFVYWTTDGMRTTGCFDITCPGFVQTSSEIALGAAISPVSDPYGLPFLITVYIFKDGSTGNWWVQYGERTNLGYWPAELFGYLHARAETAQWGGEVYSLKLGHPPHTKTNMGNGQFPGWRFGQFGSITRIRVLENSLILKFPRWVSQYADEYDCYRYFFVEDYVEDPEFYYGGPGHNWSCP